MVRWFGWAAKDSIFSMGKPYNSSLGTSSGKPTRLTGLGPSRLVQLSIHIRKNIGAGFHWKVLGGTMLVLSSMVVVGVEGSMRLSNRFA
tara:strand:+ start:7690 stop:7956 length:267 start_codon:yes stop_codon:yes gene_type:complete